MQIYSLKVNTLAQSVGEAWMEEEAEMMTELFHSELDLSPVAAENALEQKAEMIAESTVTAEVSQEREFSAEEVPQEHAEVLQGEAVGAEEVPQEHAEVLQGEAVGAGEVPREHAGVVPQEHGSPVQGAKRGRGQSGIDNGEAEGEGKAGEEGFNGGRLGSGRVRRGWGGRVRMGRRSRGRIRPKAVAKVENQRDRRLQRPMGPSRQQKGKQKLKQKTKIQRVQRPVAPTRKKKGQR